MPFNDQDELKGEIGEMLAPRRVSFWRFNWLVPWLRDSKNIDSVSSGSNAFDKLDGDLIRNAEFKIAVSLKL